MFYNILRNDFTLTGAIKTHYKYLRPVLAAVLFAHVDTVWRNTAPRTPHYY